MAIKELSRESKDIKDINIIENNKKYKMDKNQLSIWVRLDDKDEGKSLEFMLWF
mgnify:FL=1